jgi:hypothetical protein
MGVKTLLNWKIVPVSGGTVCALGMLDGTLWKTSELVKCKPGMVLTSSGTVYLLPAEAAEASMWRLALQLKRPTNYRNLVNNGVI